MKKLVLIHVLAISLAMTFWQCESDIQIDSSGFTPKLVINAQMSADARFMVSITETVSPTGETSDGPPEGIEVTMMNVTEDSEVPLYKENGIFVTHPEVNVIPGAEYMVTAEAPGFRPVSAMTKVPEDLSIDSIRVSDLEIIPSEVTPSKTNISYKISLSFPVDSDDYLHLIFRQRSTVPGNAQSPATTIEYYIEPEFPEEEGFVKHVEEGILVSLSETPNNHIEFTFRDFTIDAVGEELGDIELEVRTVSQEYYDFFVSVARQLNTIKDPFAEPVPVFNNVDGGYGNFSGFNSVFYEFSLF